MTANGWDVLLRGDECSRIHCGDSCITLWTYQQQLDGNTVNRQFLWCVNYITITIKLLWKINTHTKKKNLCTHAISGQSNDTITHVTSGKLH